jgi:hypothetical protein
MSATSEGPLPEGASYTRGVQLGEVNSGRVIRALLAACLLGLIAVTIALTISIAGDNARADRLRHQGVPVVATVTGCTGVGASINVGVEYWVCRGDYSLAGNVYNAELGGNRAELDAGTKVSAVAVPGSPSLLATAESVAGSGSKRTSYVTPLILAGVAVLGIIGFAAWYMVERGRRPPPALASQP